MIDAIDQMTDYAIGLLFDETSRWMQVPFPGGGVRVYRRPGIMEFDPMGVVDPNQSVTCYDMPENHVKDFIMRQAVKYMLENVIRISSELTRVGEEVISSGP